MHKTLIHYNARRNWHKTLIQAMLGLNLWTVGAAHGAVLKEHEILIAASNFVTQSFFGRGTEVRALEPPTATVPYWIAQLNPTGFLILSPDTRELPVIGFGTTGSLNTEARPDNALRKMLEMRGSQLRLDPTGPSEWKRLLKQTDMALLNSGPSGQIRVEPLVASRWSQWAPYNSLCPSVANGMTGYGGRAPTGCVPVAMAQILRYYSWPQTGNGTDSHADTNGVCHGNYTAIWTNAMVWEDMKDRYETWCDESPNLVIPVAQLMAKLGVAAGVDYEACGSSSDAMVLARKVAVHLDYFVGDLVKGSDPRFGQVLQEELSAHRPVIMNLQASGGHTVVADGLAEDEDKTYIHINYGWGGQNDGWFPCCDTNDMQMFGALISTIHPKVGEALISGAPNYFELTTTHNAIPQQTLRIIDCGTNGVSYTLTGSKSWISITPSRGITGGEKATHLIGLDPQQMPCGTNDGYIEISGTARNLPRKVGLRIYKPDPPQILEQPNDLQTAYPSNHIMSITAAPGQTYTPCAIHDELQYQWYYDGQPMATNQNSWCYTMGYGTYQCEVSGLGGTTRSREVTVMREQRGSRIKVVQVLNNSIKVEVENIQSGQCTLETSTDMNNWTSRQSFKIDSGVVGVLWLNIQKGDKSRFYRLRE